MNVIRTFLINFFSDVPYLISKNIEKKKKFLIFYNYLKISIRLIFINRFIKLSDESIFGYKIHFFDYGTFHFLFREIFVRGEYYIKIDKKSPLIFDCGANVGMSVIFFNWMYPDSTIFCFEPDPETFDVLLKNIAVNKLAKVKAYNLALNDKNGKMDFYKDKDNPGWLTMSLIKSRLPKDKIIVDVKKLSPFIKNNIDLLKIDVEGAEGKILSDLAKTKKINKIQSLIIEYHHNLLNEMSLSKFTNIIESSGFTYCLSAQNYNNSFDIFQDITIYAKR